MKCGFDVNGLGLPYYNRGRLKGIYVNESMTKVKGSVSQSVNQLYIYLNEFNLTEFYYQETNLDLQLFAIEFCTKLSTQNYPSL